jgi:hypothetical protein
MHRSKHRTGYFGSTRVRAVLLSGYVAMLGFMSVAMVGVWQNFQAQRYHLSPVATALVGATQKVYGDHLVYDVKNSKYDYNAGYDPKNDTIAGQTSGPKFTASVSTDRTKSQIQLTDPTSQMTVGFTPNYETDAPKQDSNRLIYPFAHTKATRVQTFTRSGIKEDIVLEHSVGDSFSYDYQMNITSDLEPRVQSDGSVGIFGPDQTLLGSVATGSPADAELLSKARQKSTKNSLLFSLPAPFVKDRSGVNRSVHVAYELSGKHLVVKATGLDRASYPLTIDPSVYITTGSDFMRGNNETNIDFDTTNQIIQKGTLTGARMNAWSKVSTNQDLPTTIWNQATVVAGGYIYSIGGNDGTSNLTKVYWAKLDTTTYNITSPTPGSGGVCTKWCNSTSYDLPVAKAGLSAVAYNGYLYAIAGRDTTPARTTTVYYAKLGANGEPISWNSTTALGTERSYAQAVAYQNRVYLLGGQSNASTGGITGAGSIQYANINPSGALGSWTSTTTNMPNALWGHTALEYNGYMYLVGGANGTTTQTAVQYVPIASSGDISGTWNTTTAFGTARATLGGAIASIWGGYMYVSGGCTTVTATDCTQYYNAGTASQSGTIITGVTTTWTSAMVGMVMTYANGITATITSFTDATHLVALYDGQTVASQAYSLDMNDLSPQLASINADGTLSAWRTVNLDAGQYYMTGTAAETTSTTNGILAGSGTTWTTDMIGQSFTWANATTTTVAGWVSATSMLAANNVAVGSQAYAVTSGVYNTGGTASQGTTAITGVNTSWTSDMNGMTIVFANGVSEIIQNVASSTSITVSATFSQTVASQVFVIRGTHTRQFSTGLTAWRNTLYQVGGCKLMNGSGGCTTPTATNWYARLNNDGDVSQRRVEPTLPTAGTGSGTTTVGRFSQGVVINNGYIYNVGGCGASPCTTAGDANANTAYAAIGSDGTITTNGITGCAGGAATWCIVATQLNTTVGLAAFGITVYNNTIYVTGGQSITANYQAHFFYLPLNSDGSPSGTFTDNGGTAGTVLTTAVGYPFVFTRAANATTGNIFAIGGCTGSAGSVGCSGYTTNVIKCTITNSTRAVSACATTGMLQLATAEALSANAIYGKYIYLCGGADGAGAAQTKTCYYAAIDSTNTIVRADTAAVTGGWQTATAQLPEIRRRSSGFAANGYMYVFGGHDGSLNGTTGTSLHDVVFAKINTTTGDLTGRAASAVFDTSSTTVTARWNLGVASANGYVYAVGGCTSGGPPTSCASAASGGISGVVESLQVYNNYSGSPLSYSTAANNIGTDSIGGRAVVSGGYIYYAGGCTSLTCTVGTDSAAVYYAPVSSNGDIATWAATTSMGTNRAYFGLTAYGGYMYAIGGSNQTTTALATTEHAFICDGTATGGCTAGGGNVGKLGTWTADTSMGAGNERADFGFSMFNGYVYVVAGSNNSGTLQTSVFHALLSSGTIGSWTTTDTAITAPARSGAVLVAYGQSLFLAGGIDVSNNYLLDTQYVNITGTGAIGTWANGTSLPQPVRQGAGFAANGYLYIFGGRSNTTACTTNTYVAPIGGYAPGSTSRFGIGNWSQTVVAYSDARFGLAAAYGPGKAYLLGGGCSALVGTGTGTTANRAFYSTLQNQPQVANYSIEIDTDTDVFPAKWLMNGVDNGTGAQWNLNYQSSTNANNVWGQNTLAGVVTLGTPGTYTPLDSGGTNTNTTVGARYYLLRVNVDASGAFGFPEDVTRGPTIADMTLEFTSDPSKRLHHGKTYTGGQLQPLDAPF